MAPLKVQPLSAPIGETLLISFTEQNFGVDLEARARADRKRVPILVTTILTYLDNRKRPMEMFGFACTNQR
jgi:hypothetical protein